MNRTLSTSIKLLLLAALVTACHDTVSPEWRATSAVLSADNATLVAGDSTLLRLTVTNHSRTRLSYDVIYGRIYGSTFDISVERENLEIWRSSKQNRAESAAYLILDPGASGELLFMLRTGSYLGADLAPGEYRVRSYLKADGGAIINTPDQVIDLTVLPDS